MGDSDLRAAQAIEVPHGLRFTVSSHDDFDVLRESARQPKGNVALPACGAIQEIVNTLENQDDLVVLDFHVADGLVFDALVAHVQPIGKVFPQFLLM